MDIDKNERNNEWNEIEIKYKIKVKIKIEYK